MESGCHAWGAAQVGSARRNARLREALASSLFERDPVRNLDAAIHEGETAMQQARGRTAGGTKNRCASCWARAKRRRPSNRPTTRRS